MALAGVDPRSPDPSVERRGKAGAARDVDGVHLDAAATCSRNGEHAATRAHVEDARARRQHLAHHVICEQQGVAVRFEYSGETQQEHWRSSIHSEHYAKR
jgi:hypothetical protein